MVILVEIDVVDFNHHFSGVCLVHSREAVDEAVEPSEGTHHFSVFVYTPSGECIECLWGYRFKR